MQLPDKPSTVDEMLKKVEYYLEVIIESIHPRVKSFRWTRSLGEKANAKVLSTILMKKL